MRFIVKYFKRVSRTSVWARPRMKVTFRAEIMPGKTKEERTFTITKVHWNGRVSLDGFAGEHRESEFEPVNR